VNLAAFHHLPTGGALRVLSEWLARTDAVSVTVYTPDPAVHAFVSIPERVNVVETAVPGPFEGIAASCAMVRSNGAHRAVAERIDAAGHDAVFVLPSRLTQSPPLLRHLRTPNVYYAPEALRLAYEDPSLVFLGDDWKVRLTRAGGNPVEWLRRSIDRRAARAARRVVTHSEFTQRDLAENYGIKSEVLRLGVDSEAFTPAHDAEARPPYVLSIGALHPLKGHDLVIDAMATLEGSAVPLVIVGDRGSEGPALAARADRLGVDLQIKHGVPFGEVIRLVQGARVVACGQIREPFGLVPLEAMAAGRPVVAVNDGGLRESVRHESTGLLVNRDAADMGAAILRLLRDPDLRSRFGAEGRRDVERHWQWLDYAQGVDRVLAGAAAHDAGQP
jgi:glycosyltransferase involved in cell wall biosynthesis